MKPIEQETHESWNQSQEFSRLAKYRPEFRRGNPNLSGGEILDRSGNRISGTQLEEIIARANSAPRLLRERDEMETQWHRAEAELEKTRDENQALREALGKLLETPRQIDRGMFAGDWSICNISDSDMKQFRAALAQCEKEEAK